MLTVDDVRSNLIPYHTYLMTDDNGQKVPRKIWYVNHETGLVRVYDNDPESFGGLLDRTQFPKERFEPITCVDELDQCWADNCRNIANSSRHPGYCANCSFERF